MSKAKIIIEDECNIRIEGLDVKTRTICSNFLKFEIPGARFSPAVKLGRWDGTTTYFSIGAKTYLNLLDFPRTYDPITKKIIYPSTWRKTKAHTYKTKTLFDVLDECGFTDFEIEDLRTDYKLKLDDIDNTVLSHINWPDTHPTKPNLPIILHDHQVEIVNAFLQNKHGTVEAATSAGKTIITATLAKQIEKYGRTFIVVPNQDLVDQTAEDYRMLGLDVGVFYGPKKNWNNKHIVATWQGLTVLYKKSKEFKPDDEVSQNDIEELVQDTIAVIIDEAHLASGDSIKNLLNGPFRNTPVRWGLTGTIPLDDHSQAIIRAMLGPVVFRITAAELQARGILAKCHVNVIQTKDNRKYASFQEEHKAMLDDEDRTIWAAKKILEISKTGNTLVLIDRVEPGQVLNDVVNGLENDASVFLYGGTKKIDRKTEYAKVREATNKIIIASASIAAVGLNIPRLFNVVLYEPGKSFVRTIQSIGRGLRKAQDKDYVDIWDISSKTKYAAKHLKERIKYYEDANYPYTITEEANWK